MDDEERTTMADEEVRFTANTKDGGGSQVEDATLGSCVGGEGSDGFVIR